MWGHELSCSTHVDMFKSLLTNYPNTESVIQLSFRHHSTVACPPIDVFRYRCKLLYASAWHTCLCGGVQLSNKAAQQIYTFASSWPRKPRIRPTSDVHILYPLPSLDEGAGGVYPVFPPHGPTTPFVSVPSAIRRPSAISRYRSVPGSPPTELLIAASTNSFRTCDACQHTARSRFAPRLSRSSSRVFVGSLGQRPTFYLAYQACTAILGCPPSRQWSTGWTPTPRHHPLPSPYVCFSLSRPPVPA